MTPKGYFRIGQVMKFLYDSAELKEWLRLGLRDGNVGYIVLTIDYAPGGFTTNAVFGTIENPNRIRKTFHMKSWSAFGPIPTPEEIMHPKHLHEIYPWMPYFIPDGKGGFSKL